MKTYIYTIESENTANPEVLLFPTLEAMQERFVQDILEDERDPLAEAHDGDPDADNYPSLGTLKAYQEAGTPIDKRFALAQQIYEWIMENGDNEMPYYHFTTDPVEVPEAPPEHTDREEEIIALAVERLHADGALEVDSDVAVSEGDDNGAYVRVWAWLDFKGTELDKQA